MIESALGFVFGLFTAWWFLAALIILAVVADYNENRGWAGFLAVLLGVGLYLVFRPTGMTLWITLGSYIPAGFLWSFFRFRRKIGTLVKDHNAYIRANAWSENELNIKVAELERSASVGRNVPSITYWICFWPVSVIQSIFDDLIALIETIITRGLRRLYEKIGLSALKKADGFEQSDK